MKKEFICSKANDISIEEKPFYCTNLCVDNNINWCNTDIDFKCEYAKEPNYFRHDGAFVI